MFEYKDGLQFINIDTDYIKTLSVACPEVSYKDIGYDRKPYIGVLVQNGDNKYAIPLTSAKDKHKAWKYVESDRLLEKVRDEYSISTDLKKTEDVVAKNVDNIAENSQ